MKTKSSPQIGGTPRTIGIALIALAIGIVVGAFAFGHGKRPESGSDQDPQKATIDRFITTYFGSWSNQDMKVYGECFAPEARIWFVGGDSLALQPFLQTQQQAHLRSSVHMREFPLNSGFTIKNGLASVWVYWQLEKAGGSVRGYDFYTLRQVQGEWRIVSLVFNEESA